MKILFSFIGEILELFQQQINSINPIKKEAEQNARPHFKIFKK